jgi:hypothetical protein
MTYFGAAYDFADDVESKPATENSFRPFHSTFHVEHYAQTFHVEHLGIFVVYKGLRPSAVRSLRIAAAPKVNV